MAPFRSPFTGDEWPDVRCAIGTIVGIANYCNEQRPRRVPPAGHDEGIRLATDAAGAIAGIPKIVRFGEIEGRQISDAYWQAKDAKAKLTPLVGDLFLSRQQWWGEAWKRNKESGESLYDYANAREEDARTASSTTRAARLAWYAANLTEKAVAQISTPSEFAGLLSGYGYGTDATLGAAAELELGGVELHTTAAQVERVWRFVVAAGRMPVPGVDDQLVEAFEAALMAGEADFAVHLAKHGYGEAPTL